MLSLKISCELPIAYLSTGQTLFLQEKKSKRYQCHVKNLTELLLHTK